MFKHITIAIGVALLTAGISFSAPGDLDLTFGTNGYVLYESPVDYINDEGRAVALQADGKIVVAGSTGGCDPLAAVVIQPDGKIIVTGSSCVLVLRYNSDGSPDQTFGTQGVVAYDGPYYGEGVPVMVLRYNSDGTPDKTFGINGVVTTSVEGYEYGNAAALQPDGKIVIAGETSNATDKYALVLRYNTDGTPDNTFGENGIVTYNGTASNWDTLSDVAIQPDGKIIVTGDTSSDVLILRYNSDGTPDTAFGTNGVVTYDSPLHYFEKGKSIALREDGKIVVAGGISDYNSYNNAVLVLRYDSNGDLDSTFGTRGVATYNRGEPDLMYGNACALLRDGRVFVTGYLEAEALIVLFNNNGGPDSVFSGDGVGTYRYNEYSFAHGYAIAIQPDGKIVVTGTSSFHDNYSDFAVLLMRIIGVGVPPCTFAITPTSQFFSSTGRTGTVEITTQLGCTWSATSNATWIIITSGNSGTGNGTVNYSVAANSSTSSRVGTMTIAGQTFTVTQEGIPTSTTWSDVISTYNDYVAGKVTWNDVIATYQEYVNSQ